MDDISNACAAAGNIAKEAPTWLDSMLTMLDKHNFLPMGETRKKNLRDKTAIQIELDTQKNEFERMEKIAEAELRARVALMDGVTKLALDAAETDIKNGASFEQAFQQHVPFAAQATSQLYFETLKGQYSQDRIALYALQEAASNPDVPVAEGETSKTYEARFWEYAKGIRDEEAMQHWGKLLANEIRQPGYFSLKTLDVLRSLDRFHADLFKEIARYVFNMKYVIEGNSTFLGIGAYELAQLESVGLIIVGRSVVIEKNDFPIFNRHYNIVGNVKNDFSQQFSALVLTRSGSELYSLVEFTEEESFEGASLAKAALSSNWDVTVERTS